MQLSGQLSSDFDRLLSHLTVASGRLDQQLKEMPKGRVRETTWQLYTDVCAVFASIITICKGDLPASSLVMASLLRCLIEGCLSVFAFVKYPDERADLYLDFRAVLDFRFACNDLMASGSPYVPADSLPQIKGRLHNATELLGRFGVKFLDGRRVGNKDPDKLLAQALASDVARAPSYFRVTWYPESRRDLLEAENMAWVYPVLYQRLCCAVHTDAGGAKILSEFPKESAAMLAFQFWGISIYKLVEQFSFRLDNQTKGILRRLYNEAQQSKNCPEHGST